MSKCLFDPRGTCHLEQRSIFSLYKSFCYRRTFFLLHVHLLHFTDVIVLQMEGKTLHQQQKNTFLWSLYCGLEPNRHYLWDMPVLLRWAFYSHFKLWSLKKAKLIVVYFAILEVNISDFVLLSIKYGTWNKVSLTFSMIRAKNVHSYNQESKMKPLQMKPMSSQGVHA